MSVSKCEISIISTLSIIFNVQIYPITIAITFIFEGEGIRSREWRSRFYAVVKYCFKNLILRVNSIHLQSRISTLTKIAQTQINRVGHYSEINGNYHEKFVEYGKVKCEREIEKSGLGIIEKFY